MMKVYTSNVNEWKVPFLFDGGHVTLLLTIRPKFSSAEAPERLPISPKWKG